MMTVSSDRVRWLVQGSPLQGPVKVEPRTNVPEKLQGVHPRVLDVLAVASVVVFSTPNFTAGPAARRW